MTINQHTIIGNVKIENINEPDLYIEIRLINWSGEATIVSRKYLEKQTPSKWKFRNAVYFLIGEEINEKSIITKIYVGSTSNVFDRMNAHKTNKDFWEKAVIFTDCNDFLCDTHMEYLERKFYDILSKSERYVLVNSTVPKGPSISEYDKISVHQFLQKIKVVLSIIGLPISI